MDSEIHFMRYTLIPTKFFLEQLDELSFKARQILGEKLELLKVNPLRNKRISGYNLFLFRIRFSDFRKEKRVVYLVKGNDVKILCILNRDRSYKDLRRYLKKFGLV